MKYLSLDLETTGIKEKSPENILMLSAIIEDPKNLLELNELPHFTCFIKHNKISGEYFALSMNSWILDIISERKPNNTSYPILNSNIWENEFHLFLNKHFSENEKITVAGKNVAAFDFHFLPESIIKRFSHRTIDPSIKFTDLVNDAKIADLSACKMKAGLSKDVAHDAREDALDIIRLLRTTY